MYFLKTIQIVLVVIAAGVKCAESRQPRPPPPNMCYSEVTSMFHPASQRYQHSMVNATGQKCYKAIPERHFNAMFTKRWSGENASAEVCPDWSNSKKCLFNHLNTRCNSTEVERYQEDLIFNYFLTSTELLCEPSENFNLLNFLKETAVEDGFSTCIVTHVARREINNCMREFIKGNNGIFEVAFQETIRALQQCYIQPIKTCSQGNIAKELHLLGQSIQLEQARLASYNAVWNQFKTPASPLLDLHNLLK
ncbi:unnamed protein product [Allacma fusca]|uniref:Uncharacterized protein n=1 Tax=Allacma fusca TaxID=39272 RepID=A0A8J2P6D5_9HEXA|nr:unnamed protein product [Allacma fusca]